MKMRPFGRLLHWRTALRRLLQAVEPVERRETLEVPHAVGRIVSTGYRARHAVPPFARATWDGYALRARSTRGAAPGRTRRFDIVGEVYAEGGFRDRIGPSEAVAIATGGALPPGADAVVRFEDVEVHGNVVALQRPVAVGDRLAERGEDVRSGAVVVRAGAVLTPADLGALSLTGHRVVSVWSRPIVSILPNGNELVSPGGPLPRGSIFESNNATLSAVVEASGGIARPLPPVPDDPRRIESEIRKALRSSDLVLVTGGSSVGERDYLPAVFPRLGKLLFHGIAIRPGKPTLAVRAGRKVVVGMPGHPTSCLSNGYWLLLPALRKLARLRGAGWVSTPVRFSEGVGVARSSMATVIPLDVRDGVGRPTFRDSSAISSLGGANAFVLWPPDRRGPRRGQRVSANLLPPPVGHAVRP